MRHRPIPGLYMAGNDMHSVMGGEYPTPGITLGPALTFGWIAGGHSSAPTHSIFIRAKRLHRVSSMTPPAQSANDVRPSGAVSAIRARTKEVFR